MCKIIKHWLFLHIILAVVGGGASIISAVDHMTALVSNIQWKQKKTSVKYPGSLTIV